ncbi:MAG: class I SAM-dependent methyltransferase [Bacteroidota bacterium]
MNDIAIFAGDRATTYDSFANDWIPFYPQLMASVPSLLASELPVKASEVLVVGSGTGNELRALAQQHPDWSLTGIDPSPELVQQARQKLAAFPNVQLYDGYVTDLPTANQYQAATLLLVLHFVPDDGSKLALLRAIAQRLRPGAPFLLADIYGSPAELSVQLPLLRRLLPPHLDPEAVAHRLKHLPERIQHVSTTRLRQLLVDSGFEPPRQFFKAAIYGAWWTKKRS